MGGSMKERAGRLAARYFTLDTLWRVALPLTLLVMMFVRSPNPHDFWWHLRMGEIIVAEGRVPTVDRFSFTRAGVPWVDQNWLMQLAMLGVYRLGGLPLSIAFNALTITAGYTLLLLALARRHGTRPAVVGVFLAALVGSQNWGVRPQAFSFLAFGALIYLLEAHRAGNRRALWWAVPLMALWSNCHGVFLYGLFLLGLYCLFALARAYRAGRLSNLPLELIAVPVLALLSLGLNPLGPRGAWDYLAGFFDPGDVTTTATTEWQPLTIRQPHGVIFLASLAVTGPAVVAIAPTTGRRPLGGTGDFRAALALGPTPPGLVRLRAGADRGRGPGRPLAATIGAGPPGHQRRPAGRAPGRAGLHLARLSGDVHAAGATGPGLAGDAGAGGGRALPHPAPGTRVFADSASPPT